MVLKGDQEAAAALSVSGRYCEREPLLGSVSALLWAPLGQEELQSQAGGPRWRALRCSLLTLFWLACLAMLGRATTIIVQTPRPVPPRLHWWQKDLFYQIEPSLFLDTNQDGIGDINGIRASLPYLQSLRVGALILGPLFSSLAGSGSPPNLTRINQTVGSIEDFEALIAHSNSLGIRILLDLCSVTLWHSETFNTSSNHTLPDPNTSHLGTVKSALQFWLEQGVAGFRICDAETINSEQALEEWQAVIKVYSSKEDENERILIVSSVNADSQWQDADIVKRSLADLFTRPLLPPSRGNLSQDRKWLTRWSEALLTPPEAWPSWMLGGPKVGHLGELPRLFSVLIFTLPGTPFLYYGDEIGLHEQQNNSVTELPPMRWGSYQIPGTARHPTGSPGGVETQISVEAELKEKRSVLKLFKSLSQARALEVALQCGNFTLLPSSTTAPSPVLAFLRSWECVHFLILLNFGHQEASLTDHLTPGLPTRGAIVVSSRLDRQGAVALDTLRLQPREALVVKLFDTSYNRS
ncbi:4F2 cell-surface antigen heavy chain [Acipenser oxyrinchus oxyrinchus]|uniref:4F2 cell-surface antigen heavy chain n=1 Tax=Acipenser oxyrinchus oxyrinchus TaxID=40147 RepID=A0AAD8CN19_ACIOX|nr:4F2 cell-surface antigen heavy chain [Acipenser oxyrinchus oxyrinchus]